MIDQLYLSKSKKIFKHLNKRKSLFYILVRNPFINF
jgi:hypothetical protein